MPTTTPTRSDPGKHLLQGVIWSMALNTANGKMVTTFSSRDGAYVLFGSCTPL